MLKVSIFSPYGRNDTTLTALLFADWLVRLGVDVSLLSSSMVASGVHDYWDKRVLKYTKSSVRGWDNNCTHRLWFGCDMTVLSNTARNNRKTEVKNLYVPSWATADSVSVSVLPFVVDRILCSRASVAMFVSKLSVAETQTEKYVAMELCHADRMLKSKVGYVSAAERRLLIVLPSTKKTDINESLFGTMETLLSQTPKLKLSLVTECGLNAKDRSALKRLLQDYPSRVLYLPKLPYSRYAAVVRSNDWVYLAETRQSYGSRFALLSGRVTPVIHHDLAGGAIGSGMNNSHRVKATLKMTSDVAPRVVVDYLRLTDTLLDIINLPADTFKRQQKRNIRATKLLQVQFEGLLFRELVS